MTWIDCNRNFYSEFSSKQHSEWQKNVNKIFSAQKKKRTTIKPAKQIASNNSWNGKWKRRKGNKIKLNKQYTAAVAEFTSEFVRCQLEFTVWDRGARSFKMCVNFTVSCMRMNASFYIVPRSQSKANWLAQRNFF